MIKSKRFIVSISLRTCLGCYKTTIKNELIRIVRADDGSIIADLHGKRAGRGLMFVPNWIVYLRR